MILFFRLAFRRIITTFDALRRAGINENDDIVELLYLLLDFVKILDPKGYEQLSEGFDLVGFYIFIGLNEL